MHLMVIGLPSCGEKSNQVDELTNEWARRSFYLRIIWDYSLEICILGIFFSPRVTDLGESRRTDPRGLIREHPRGLIQVDLQKKQQFMVKDSKIKVVEYG